jgi:KUP system potassium uptake protein
MSQQKKSTRTATLTLAALGVVYGDIGTSPLYTVKEVFAPATGIALNAPNLIGAVSAIFWSLMLVVTLKYVVLILRADNHGEGGGLALTALAANAVRHIPMLRTALLILGVFGATLFYGDSVITPAISVMGALEGLEVLTPDLKPYVLPLSIFVLLLLFLAQKKGTEAVGKFFGPIIALWFLVLGITGVLQIMEAPAILAALNPFLAIQFLIDRGPMVLAAVGAIVLALTGAEALYADMGHFGRKPIQMAWMGLVLPSLALHYLGQGALLMTDPEAIENPFFKMFPEFLLIPAVVLATMAAIIASQAVISGVFSMTQQALQLGFLPRMKVLQTSEASIGQIYVPAVNAALCAATVGLVLAFQTSDSLAGAYGIAVVCTMLITAVLMDVLLFGRSRGDIKSRWLLALSLPLAGLYSVFLASNIYKNPQGGWFPLMCGLFVFIVMRTWMRGRTIFSEQMRRQERSLETFLDELGRAPPKSVAGTAVFLSGSAEGVARTLTRNVRSNGVLHEHTVLMSVVTERIPRVPRGGRLKVRRLADQIWRVEAHVGFMERADVPRLLREAERVGLGFRTDSATYFLGRDDVVVSSPRGMATWRKHLFLFMSRNAEFAGTHFGIPPERIIELGGQVAI